MNTTNATRKTMLVGSGRVWGFAFGQESFQGQGSFEQIEKPAGAWGK